MKAQLFTMLLLVSAGAQSATLTPKSGVSVLFVDGVEVQDKRAKLDIPDGNVQLVVKYNKQLKDAGKKRVFDSNPFVITLAASNENLQITPPKLYTYEQAKLEFKENPKWVIETSTGENVSYRQEVLDRAEGFMPYFNMPERVEMHNKARGVVIGPQATLAEKAITVSSTSASHTANSDTNNLEQLKAWYVKASKQERKEFRRWMIDQE